MANHIDQIDPRLERMSKIAERFPTLRNVPGVRPFDEELLRAQDGGHGQQLAIQFVLNVWNADNPFNVGEARHTWDDPHRQAFAAFVAQDWRFCP